MKKLLFALACLVLAGAFWAFRGEFLGIWGAANSANAEISANSTNAENAENSVNFSKNSARNSRTAGKKRVIIKELTPLKCNLNETPCEYEFQGRKVRVEFRDKPILAMVENELVIENLGDFGALDMRIYGLNMFMGDITPRLKALPHSAYKASVVLSSCVVKVMRFRAEFFKDGKQLDFYFDFDVKR